MLGLAAEAVTAEIAVSMGHKLTLDDDGLITSAEPTSHARQQRVLGREAPAIQTADVLTRA